MTLRRRGALGAREARTQGVLVAALRARTRTTHGAAHCGPTAEVSFLGSLLVLPLLLGVHPVPGDARKP